MTSTPSAKPSSAYFFQAAVAFAIALGVVVIGIVYLPVPGWTRAFLGLGTVFLVSSSFTLSKCVRDQQETENVVSRLDQARIERLLAEFDPYRTPGLPPLHDVSRADDARTQAPNGAYPPPPAAYAG